MGKKYLKELDALGSAKKQEVKGIEKKMREANRKAQKSAKDAVAMATRSDNKFLLGTALSHLARMYLLNSKFDKALATQSQALGLFQQIDEKHEQASCIILGAEITWRKKDSDKALEMGNEGLELARKVKDANAEEYAIELLGIIYKEQEALALPQMATQQMAIEGGGGGPDMAQSIVKE